ncbi:hypothetical protein GOV07_01075 [Candidatus Woesearchaeota archaeon]|nr:hypothetical protein [Candidatus Woesearchaeota archaeon]
MFFLGIYQLNEFLICITGVSVFTKLAMIITAILPALAVSFALIMSRKKVKYYWHLLIYTPAIFFVTMFAIFYYGESAICQTVFIQYPTAGILGDFFALYYLTYIVGTGVLFYLFSQRIKKKEERVMLHLGMLSMAVFTAPTLVFLIFLPKFFIQLPSVLCEFALLTAITMIVMLWYKKNHNLRY